MIGIFFIFTLSNLSFPGSLGFISEILILFSTLAINPLIMLLVTLVTIILPIYFMYFYQKISYGKISPYLSTIYQDITIKEINLVIPLIILNIIFGIFPNYIKNDIHLNLD
jgi:NADH:ubiquinone oxidoreductase subunit 4 (subunit M)